MKKPVVSTTPKAGRGQLQRQPTKLPRARQGVGALKLGKLQNGQLIGWALLVRNGPEVIEQVHRRDLTIALGSSPSRPQIRVRSLSVYAEETGLDEDGVEVDEKILWPLAKSNMPQIRALVMCGEVLTLETDDYEAIIDRHPDCPHDIVDKGLKRLIKGAQRDHEARRDRVARKSYRLLRKVDSSTEEIRASLLREIEWQLEVRKAVAGVLPNIVARAPTDLQRTQLERLAPSGRLLSYAEFMDSIAALYKGIDWALLTPQQKLELSSFGLNEGAMDAIKKLSDGAGNWRLPRY